MAVPFRTKHAPTSPELQLPVNEVSDNGPHTLSENTPSLVFTTQALPLVLCNSLTLNVT